MIFNLLLATTDVVTESGIIADLGEFFSGLDGLRNFIVSVGGLGFIAILLKVRTFLNLVRKPGFEKQAIEFTSKYVGELVKKPELVNEITQALLKIPTVNKAIDEFADGKEKIVLELEGRIFDVEAKIKSGLFEDDELARLVEYKAKLLEHVSKLN